MKSGIMRRTVTWLLIPLLLLAAWAAWRMLRSGQQPLQANIVLAAAAQTGPEGFARAEGPRSWSFPADYGPHNDFQTEWWYYTGNLTAPTGEHLGYQLTFFRRALVPPSERTGRTSDWATQQVYMAHLALTDVSGRQHVAYQRLERGAAGLAGAQSGAQPDPKAVQAQPYRVWLDNWSVSAVDGGVVRLQAADGDIALRLDLRDLKPPVLQGDTGYSRKGPEPGNASYYYSLTRIATTGTVTVRGQTYPVDGLSWMDHEFSTSALSAGAVGWDWFSLQLSDGRELMIFRIRHADGSADPFSAGTLVAADGATRRLSPDEFKVDPTGQWRSPHTGAVYPSGWKLAIPSAGLDLTATPYVPDQELNVGYNYWEGAVRVEGQAGGKTVTGSGYVELTGYAGSMSGQF